MTYKPGDKLLYVPYEPRVHEREVIIEKVGRRWLTFCKERRLRVDAKTLIADGGDYASPGRCYQSREAWERSVDANEVWVKLCDRIHPCGRKENVFAESILEAAKLLGIELP